MKDYDSIQKTIEELTKAYKTKPVTREVEERKISLQEYLKKGVLAIPNNPPSQEGRESEVILKILQRQLKSDQQKLNEIINYEGPVKINREGIETLEMIREENYSLVEEIIKRVEQGKVPEGYDHEVSYLNLAKEICEASRKSDEYLKEIAPYEGKTVFFMDGKLTTLKGSLKDAWKEFKERKPKS